MLEWVQSMDEVLILAVQEMRLEVLDPIVKWYTSLGNVGAVWIVGSAALMIPKSTRTAGKLGFASLALGLLCTNVMLKNLVGRPRPWLAVPELIPLIEEGDPNSFPSGHSCAAWASCLAWALSLNRTWITCLCVGAAVCMAFSRLYLGVHYPSDVICGSLIGACCALVVWKGYQRNTIG